MKLSARVVTDIQRNEAEPSSFFILFCLAPPSWAVHPSFSVYNSNTNTVRPKIYTFWRTFCSRRFEIWKASRFIIIIVSTRERVCSCVRVLQTQSTYGTPGWNDVRTHVEPFEINTDSIRIGHRPCAIGSFWLWCFLSLVHQSILGSTVASGMIPAIVSLKHQHNSSLAWPPFILTHVKSSNYLCIFL